MPGGRRDSAPQGRDRGASDTRRPPSEPDPPPRRPAPPKPASQLPRPGGPHHRSRPDGPTACTPVWPCGGLPPGAVATCVRLVTEHGDSQLRPWGAGSARFLTARTPCAALRGTCPGPVAERGPGRCRRARTHSPAPGASRRRRPHCTRPCDPAAPGRAVATCVRPVTEHGDSQLRPRGAGSARFLTARTPARPCAGPARGAVAERGPGRCRSARTDSPAPGASRRRRPHCTRPCGPAAPARAVTTCVRLVTEHGDSQLRPWGAGSARFLTARTPARPCAGPARGRWRSLGPAGAGGRGLSARPGGVGAARAVGAAAVEGPRPRAGTVAVLRAVAGVAAFPVAPAARPP
ncbi:hypothetical protein RKD29_001694 [Streptomyces tendae]